MRKGIYLFGFSLLCVTVLLGSSALVHQDTPHVSLSLPTVSEKPRCRAYVSEVYVPMSASNARLGTPIVAQSVAMGMAAAQGQVMSAATPASVHSYGGGALSAGTGSAMAVSAPSAQAAVATVAVPQVSHRSMAARNNTQRSVASVRRSAPRRGMKGQPTATAQSMATAASDLSLGYEAASSYINRSSMRKPPAQGSSWNEWLREIYGDTQYVDMNTLYDTWLSQQGNTNMPGNGTWEEFEEWFKSDQNTYYRVPVGDGAIWLLLLAGLYILVKYMRSKTHKPIEIQ